MEYEIDPEESVSHAVVFAVSAFEGRDPLTFDAADQTLDPDALAGVFNPRPDGTPRVGGRVSFVYGRCHVTVKDGERIEITAVSRDPYPGTLDTVAR